LNSTPSVAAIDGALVWLVNGELEYYRFEDLLDLKTKKTAVRGVDITKPCVIQGCARIHDPFWARGFRRSRPTEKLAKAASSQSSSVSPESFQNWFERLMQLRGGL
jgi:hypothetical protein